MLGFIFVFLGFRDGKSRQFAFVGFRTEHEAEEAIRYFNKSYLDTCRIVCEVGFFCACVFFGCVQLLNVKFVALELEVQLESNLAELLIYE